MGHEWKAPLAGGAVPERLVTTGNPEYAAKIIDFQASTDPFRQIGGVAAQIINRAASLSGRSLPFSEGRAA